MDKYGKKLLFFQAFTAHAAMARMGSKGLITVETRDKMIKNGPRVQRWRNTSDTYYIKHEKRHNNRPFNVTVYGLWKTLNRVIFN